MRALVPFRCYRLDAAKYSNNSRIGLSDQPYSLADIQPFGGCVAGAVRKLLWNPWPAVGASRSIFREIGRASWYKGGVMEPARGRNKTTDPAFVVIAEDDPALAELIAFVVEQAGGTPLVAYDGAQALQLARSYAPSVVITDLMMPYLPGDALIAALREERGADLPIVLISAAPHAQLQRTGADAVLPKPFDVLDLHELLDHYLAVYRPTKVTEAPIAEPWGQPGPQAAQPERRRIPVGETVLPDLVIEQALTAPSEIYGTPVNPA